jgi:hypothetical protein
VEVNKSPALTVVLDEVGLNGVIGEFDTDLAAPENGFFGGLGGPTKGTRVLSLAIAVDAPERVVLAVIDRFMRVRGGLSARTDGDASEDWVK